MNQPNNTQDTAPASPWTLSRIGGRIRGRVLAGLLAITPVATSAKEHTTHSEHQQEFAQDPYRAPDRLLTSLAYERLKIMGYGTTRLFLAHKTKSSGQSWNHAIYALYDLLCQPGSSTSKMAAILLTIPIDDTNISDTEIAEATIALHKIAKNISITAQEHASLQKILLLYAPEYLDMILKDKQIPYTQTDVIQEASLHDSIRFIIRFCDLTDTQKIQAYSQLKNMRRRDMLPVEQESIDDAIHRTWNTMTGGIPPSEKTYEQLETCFSATEPIITFRLRRAVLSVVQNPATHEYSGSMPEYDTMLAALDDAIRDYINGVDPDQNGPESFAYDLEKTRVMLHRSQQQGGPFPATTYLKLAKERFGNSDAYLKARQQFLGKIGLWSMRVASIPVEEFPTRPQDVRASVQEMWNIICPDDTPLSDASAQRIQGLLTKKLKYTLKEKRLVEEQELRVQLASVLQTLTGVCWSPAMIEAELQKLGIVGLTVDSREEAAENAKLLLEHLSCSPLYKITAPGVNRLFFRVYGKIGKASGLSGNSLITCESQQKGNQWGVRIRYHFQRKSK